MKYQSDEAIRDAVLENKEVYEALEHLIQDMIEYPGESHKGELALFMKTLEGVVEVERNREEENYSDTGCYGLE